MPVLDRLTTTSIRHPVPSALARLPWGGDKRTRGFTLVEALIVLAILGVVLALGIPAFQSYMDRSRVLEARVQIGELAKAIKAYERRTGRHPATLSDLVSQNSMVIVTNDPWGNAYRYLDLRVNPIGMARKDKSAAPINSDFDLYSIGKDAQTQLQLNQAVSRDDVVRARDGAFIGLAEEFDP